MYLGACGLSACVFVWVVCMYVCVGVYVGGYVCVGTYRLDVYLCVRVSVCAYVRMYLLVEVCVWVHFVCMCINTCVCVCVCVVIARTARTQERSIFASAKSHGRKHMMPLCANMYMCGLAYVKV